MWPAEPVDIEVSRNAVTPIGIQLWDEAADAPLNISGFTLTCGVASDDGLVVLSRPSIEVASYTTGEFDVTFSGPEISGGTTSRSRSVYSYEIKAQDGSGKSVIVMRGPLILVPGVL